MKDVKNVEDFTLGDPDYLSDWSAGGDRCV
jgi:hypothetical protein